jgi:hypothetical protein
MRDSTIAFVGFVETTVPPVALHDDLTQNVSFEIGSKYTSTANAATAESVYVVTCTGAAKTRTGVGRFAQGTVIFLKMVFKASSIDFYFGTTYAGLGSAINVATNLPTFTNGMTPFFGEFTWQLRSVTNQVAGITIDAWQYDEWLSR